jgi:gamma-glutamylcyclotransferase (GGCT)/AIG2-like uncharacterized protein YtfP
LAAYLFVYGTLRKGSNNKFARLLAEQSDFVGPARVPGRLYDFGRYPGARPANQPDESIAGEVYRLRAPAQLLATLDEYEGPDFERAIVSAGAIECWIYWYVGPDAGRLIPSGEWFAN